MINGESNATLVCETNGYDDTLAISVKAEYRREYPVFDNVLSVTTNRVVNDAAAPFVYNNKSLFTGKTITKIGIFVTDLTAAVTADQTMTVYIIDKSLTKNYNGGRPITVTIPKEEFEGDNASSINRWIYATDFKDANGNSLDGISLTENENIAFGAISGDTINWGYLSTQYSEYAFTTNSGGGGNASLIFDVYVRDSFSISEIEDVLDKKEEEAIKNAELDALKAQLVGKNFSILGDSISTFAGYNTDSANTNSTIGSNKVYYTGSNCGITSVNMTWWHQAAVESGMNVLVNNAYSGDRVTTLGQSRCLQLHDDTGENAGTNPDIIAVYLGINDFDNNVSTAAFATAYDTMIASMTEKYNGADVYLFTLVPNKTRVDDATMRIYNQTIMDTAAKYGCTIVDLYNDSGINANNCSQYMGDGSPALHPNPEGMDLITDCFIRVLMEKYL